MLLLRSFVSVWCNILLISCLKVLPLSELFKTSNQDTKDSILLVCFPFSLFVSSLFHALLDIRYCSDQHAHAPRQRRSSWAWRTVVGPQRSFCWHSVVVFVGLPSPIHRLRSSTPSTPTRSLYKVPWVEEFASNFEAWIVAKFEKVCDTSERSSRFIQSGIAQLPSQPTSTQLYKSLRNHLKHAFSENSPKSVLSYHQSSMHRNEPRW